MALKLKNKYLHMEDSSEMMSGPAFNSLRYFLSNLGFILLVGLGSQWSGKHRRHYYCLDHSFMVRRSAGRRAAFKPLTIVPLMKTNHQFLTTILFLSALDKLPATYCFHSFVVVSRGYWPRTSHLSPSL